LANNLPGAAEAVEAAELFLEAAVAEAVAAEAAAAEAVAAEAAAVEVAAGNLSALPPPTRVLFAQGGP
jgi:hypothetical protein